MGQACCFIPSVYRQRLCPTPKKNKNNTQQQQQQTNVKGCVSNFEVIFSNVKKLLHIKQLPYIKQFENYNNNDQYYNRHEF